MTGRVTGRVTEGGQIGDGLARSLIETLGANCAIAAGLARALAMRGEGATVDRQSLPFSPPASLNVVMDDFCARRWITRESNGWRIGPMSIPAGLASFLEGAATMHSALADRCNAQAVITLPPSPSFIERALPSTGFSYASLLSTTDAWRKVADKAVNTLTMMTPFLNEDGLKFATATAKRSRAKVRRLIIRQRGGARDVAVAGAGLLSDAGLEVLLYDPPDGSGYETFHAKVALADAELAYVGSANFTVFARHSVDLGLLVDGKAARVIASVVSAVERVAVPVVTKIVSN